MIAPSLTRWCSSLTVTASTSATDCDAGVRERDGVIFKVYMVRKYIKCVKMTSLPGVSEEEKLGDWRACYLFRRCRISPSMRGLTIKTLGKL
ncbi:LOW QUALITY PROTEIN: Inositol-tetrakisphosphate 1-kinase [Trema orientale]|uniref:Inositol-tetrakisphosphate 1-kinase n=1 Tax=Trema orientale TaxID=63057 RepID=A0A2P5FM18_TREOI|nr:LOW QUALITY PROTEIN: Inositol-tetrakisphosphate 1-kinase [Trema orientale]